MSVDDIKQLSQKNKMTFIVTNQAVKKMWPQTAPEATTIQNDKDSPVAFVFLGAEQEPTILDEFIGSYHSSNLAVIAKEPADMGPWMTKATENKMDIYSVEDISRMSPSWTCAVA